VGIFGVISNQFDGVWITISGHHVTRWITNYIILNSYFILVSYNLQKSGLRKPFPELLLCSYLILSEFIIFSLPDGWYIFPRFVFFLVCTKEEKSVAINHDTRVLNPRYMGKAAFSRTNNNVLQRKFILSLVVCGARSGASFHRPLGREREEEREINISSGMG
jgi:hypothetical protein